MKIVGLIAEYNPFHNGHKYHIEKALEMTDSDAAVVLMSGDFVQRGAPAIMPKHLRAEAALKSGASAVLELPVCYACGSAEYFARGALAVFESLGCVESICFGSECGDFDTLNKIARIFAEEPEEYQTALRTYLRRGLSFPLARQKALRDYTGDAALEAVLDYPNNTLGVEYIKAIYLAKSSVRAYTLKRLDSDYHDTELSNTYSSASAIRRLLAYSSNSLHIESDTEFDEPRLTEVLTRLEDHVPAPCIRLLEENHRIRYPVYSNDFSLLLKYRLLSETKESLTEYADVTQDLANRIINYRNSLISWEQFCDLLKTREITMTRVSRMLLHILLGIRKSDLLLYEESGICQYARLLGFRKDSTLVLREMKRNASVPLITKLASARGITRAGIHMLEQGIYAADIYESVVTNKYKYPFISEYEQQLRIV
ncbi:MAG: nucleotidyltransferase family protein [Bariatricus massiliensis]|nr:nucleotidyltransferase family protein [Bariatricus massiliensis]